MSFSFYTLFPRNPNYELHFAASTGDLAKIKYLIENRKMNVNQEDTRSTRPLHVAALFGHNEVVKLLLSYGAKVEDEGYFGQTALNFAIQNKHYEVARTLVTQGKANPHHQTEEGITPFISMLDQLTDTLLSPCKPSLQHSEKINEIIRTLSLFFDHAPIHRYAASGYADYPLSLTLKRYNPFLPDMASQEQLLLLTEKIKTYDAPLDARFMHAKNLFLTFPVEEKEYILTKYTLTIDPDRKMIFYPNGYFTIFSTELAKESLNTYSNHLGTKETDPIKMALFSKLTHIYENAFHFASQAGDIKTAQTALDLYHTGETILLPTGWDGHAVNVILSKKQGYYVTNNSGERYPNDPSGNIFHSIEEPNKIDLKFFQDTLFNQDQMKLEYERLYEYGLAKQTFHIKTPEQKFDNCAWTSHLNSIESILYIELLNHQFTSKEALTTSHTYYEEWKHFHGLYVIDQYLSDPLPGLPEKAFTDIIKALETEPSTKENNEYIERFKEIINAPLPEPELKPTLPKFWSWLTTSLSWWKEVQHLGKTIEMENVGTNETTFPSPENIIPPITSIDLQPSLVNEYF